MPTALISGITGQDGSYLAELLLGIGYEVHGIVRWTSTENTGRIKHLLPHLNLHSGDLSDSARLSGLIRSVKPDEIYNLGALSHVKVSFDVPEYTANVTGLGALRFLEAIRLSGRNPKYYQASSSEMFGSSPPPQNENTPFRPRSPYGCAKVFAYHAVVNYREAYGLHASNGILFNHESPRRGEHFVTRKITKAIGRIVSGDRRPLYLGNMEAKRDWGFAGDFVRAMWMMLQRPDPDDYVIATGQMRTVQEFTELAFKQVGLDYREYVQTDPALYRPTEVDALQGDATKARQILGWQPEIPFEKLVEIMVNADLPK